MSYDRGASRGLIIALIVVAAGLAGLATALGLFEGYEPGPEAAQTTTSATLGDEMTTVQAEPTTTSAITVPADDPLCPLIETLTAALDGHLPVEGAEDLEAWATAQLGFYTAAAAVVEPPQHDAFAEMMAYHQEVAAYYEPLEWNPSPGLDVLTDSPPPQPPAAAVAVVQQTMTDRCDIEVTTE